MANLRDIRHRIESVRNTKQITKAMKMVAASKLRKAQDRIIETRPYTSNMEELVGRIAQEANKNDILLQEREPVENILFIIIGSDRGLCGAFNHNLFRELKQRINKDYSTQKENGNLSLITIGRKPTKHFKKRGYNIEQEFPGFFDEMKFSRISEIMKTIISQFKIRAIDEVVIAFNEFESVIVQNCNIEKVLPIDPDTLLVGKEASHEYINYIYEPDVDAILEELLPLHLRMQLWQAVLESNAAEQGARMTSMDNATDNAEELEDDLQLEYNRARQSAITTEISEIMGGAQALKEA
ncbi:MAG TPA: ATP synthase F1 subunit gamma [Balneolaceae bacterium]|nr:ATP synthase F1 subunit gamma [Balneolaceae bacterium]